jgi:hypothetical protein
MGRTAKSQKLERNERHSAAWGKRLSRMLVLSALVLATGMAFGQQSKAYPQERVFSKALSPEVTHLINHFGATSSQQLRVIVQYKHAPQAAHWAKVQGMGGRMGSNLHLINSTAYSMPANRLDVAPKWLIRCVTSGDSALEKTRSCG